MCNISSTNLTLLMLNDTEYLQRRPGGPVRTPSDLLLDSVTPVSDGSLSIEAG